MILQDAQQTEIRAARTGIRADAGQLQGAQASRRIETMPEDGLSFFGQGSNGRGILLLHGITGSPVEMKLVAKKLHRAGYTVYAPLLTGHGADLAALRQTRWKDWHAGVLRAADWFVDRCDQMFVAGICGGGLLGLRLVHERPSIKAAAVFSPLLRYDGWNAPMHYRLGRFTVPVAVRLGFAQFISVKERHPFGIKSERIRRLLAETDGGLRGTLPAFPVETLHQTHRMFDWVKKTLPRITTPTLLVHSRIDDLAGPSNAEYINRRIGGPCEIAWLENSYHMIHVDQEHSKVAQRVQDYFDRYAE